MKLPEKPFQPPPFPLSVHQEREALTLTRKGTKTGYLQGKSLQTEGMKEEESWELKTTGLIVSRPFSVHI